MQSHSIYSMPVQVHTLNKAQDPLQTLKGDLNAVNKYFGDGSLQSVHQLNYNPKDPGVPSLFGFRYDEKTHKMVPVGYADVHPDFLPNIAKGIKNFNSLFHSLPKSEQQSLLNGAQSGPATQIFTQNPDLLQAVDNYNPNNPSSVTALGSQILSLNGGEAGGLSMISVMINQFESS